MAENPYQASTFLQAKLLKHNKTEKLPQVTIKGHVLNFTGLILKTQITQWPVRSGLVVLDRSAVSLMSRMLISCSTQVWQVFLISLISSALSSIRLLVPLKSVSVHHAGGCLNS